ncbi:hypothetical protein JTE90_008032 [Oedothorax gibbosus]|uniref:Cuticle protein n=1 Tax=Oedothorax gibbosus TaxID=931172 RepID=A0AAV6UVH8_9ARAC|nr:hypothetical protein JTE90_008032 [Oedothorax gibbosus]
MIALIIPLVLSSALALPHGASIYSGAGVYGPSYNTPLVQAVQVSGHPSPDTLSHTLTNVQTHTGAVKQQTTVGKDVYGGHTIRHSAQATNVDPHSGQTDVKHDEHEFHINPYKGEAAVHTNNAEGSLNPTIGKAAFAQKVHEAKIAPGHASVADVADTAAVSPHSSAASRDVNAARTDVIHDGIAKNAHKSHKSYVNTPGVGGHSKAAETNQRSFDGHGYGSLHYDNQNADDAYDAHGHVASNDNGYKLDQAYDTRVNLGSHNEVEYSRHASKDPYGNYAAVTQSRTAEQHGQLVPVHQEYQPAIVKEVTPVVHQEAAVYYPQPQAVKEVGYSKYSEPESYVYANPAPVAYQKQVVYNEPAPVAYPQQVVYNEPLPVTYQKHASLVYSEPVPVSYHKHSELVYEPSVVYKRPVAYKQPVAYKSQAYGPVKYSNGGYY